MVGYEVIDFLGSAEEVRYDKFSESFAVGRLHIAPLYETSGLRPVFMGAEVFLELEHIQLCSSFKEIVSAVRERTADEDLVELLLYQIFDRAPWARFLADFNEVKSAIQAGRRRSAWGGKTFSPEDVWGEGEDDEDI
ncbi:MAG: hypothetical protein QW134_01025 [Nitrososphaeria archaeon]